MIIFPYRDGRHGAAAGPYVCCGLGAAEADSQCAAYGDEEGHVRVEMAGTGREGFGSGDSEKQSRGARKPQDQRCGKACRHPAQGGDLVRRWGRSGLDQHHDGRVQGEGLHDAAHG